MMLKGLEELWKLKKSSGIRVAVMVYKFLKS